MVINKISKKNTRRKNTRRNTRRKNTRRKNSRRKHTRRKNIRYTNSNRYTRKRNAIKIKGGSGDPAGQDKNIDNSVSQSGPLKALTPTPIQDLKSELFLSKYLTATAPGLTLVDFKNSPIKHPNFKVRIENGENSVDIIKGFLDIGMRLTVLELLIERIKKHIQGGFQIPTITPENGGFQIPTITPKNIKKANIIYESIMRNNLEILNSEIDIDIDVICTVLKLLVYYDKGKTGKKSYFYPYIKYDIIEDEFIKLFKITKGSDLNLLFLNELYNIHPTSETGIRDFLFDLLQKIESA